MKKIFMFLITFLTLVSFVQCKDNFKIEDKGSVRFYHSPKGIYKTFISNGNPVEIFDFYENGELKEIQKINPNWLKDNNKYSKYYIAEEYYRNGNLKSRKNIEYRSKFYAIIAESWEYYENGNLKSSREIDEDSHVINIDGNDFYKSTSKEYYPNGVIKHIYITNYLVEGYKYVKNRGLSESYDFYENGNLKHHYIFDGTHSIYTADYYFNGNLKKEERVNPEDGVIIISSEYYPNGVISTDSFQTKKNGKYEKIEREYDPSGKRY